MKAEKEMYDVVIVGGGISGAAAGISASRNGSKTLIVEKNGYLGGMLTAAGVGPMMTFHAGDKQVVKGIVSELIDRLKHNGKSTGHVFDTIGYTYTVTPFDAEALKHELELMYLESGGKLLYHTMLAGVDVGNGKIKSITVCNKGGLSRINSRVFIDATGDADLSAWSGVECKKGREEDGACQPMTTNMKMANVDIEAVKKYVKDNPDEFPFLKGNTWMVDKAERLSVSGFAKTLKVAKEKGEVSSNLKCVLFFETNNPGEVIVNTTKIMGKDATDPWSLTDAEIEGRKQVREVEAFLRNRVAGFENSVLLYSGPEIGIRSSRQITGLYTINQDDIISCRRFEDAIAHAGYPIDIHSPDGKDAGDGENYEIGWGGIYSIPYRSLVNGEIDNLITVGRCISATFEAQAAIRTTPTAGAIGQAGGAAASIAAYRQIAARDVDIKAVQGLLVSQGAYLIL